MFAKAQITFASIDDARLVAYLVVNLTNARVSSVVTSSGGDRPMEQLSLGCEQIRWTFQPRTGEEVTFGWDLLNLKPLPA